MQGLHGVLNMPEYALNMVVYIQKTALDVLEFLWTSALQ